MEHTTSPVRRFRWGLRRFIAIGCAVWLAGGEAVLFAQEAKKAPEPPAASATEPAAEDPKIPPEQLDSLVAPIALFPDDPG